ncbi:hypothetical protein GCM10027176_69950 [Actinoallomurus bryophytorum]
MVCVLPTTAMGRLRGSNLADGHANAARAANAMTGAATTHASRRIGRRGFLMTITVLRDLR